MPKIRIRTHPGAVLREEFLTPLGMSANALAQAIGVPSNRVSDIIRERRGMTADTALRLERYFGLKAETWLGLQADHDLSKALAENGDYSKIAPRSAA
jgi:addiction module HigA family antidote